MKGLINYFIKYPISGNVLLFLILAFGIIGLMSMRSTFFPENESKIIQVQTIYPGASPEEIEEGIVAKIEDNLEGLTGIDRVTSVSKENSGNITIEIIRGQNIDIILQDVKNAVDQINSFPEGMESPIIFKLEVLNRAVNFAISGDVSLKTLKRFAREIEDDLLAQDGISKVELLGFPEEEIEVAVKENDLRAYNLTFDEVVRAVGQANIEITGGTIKAEDEELLIRAKTKSYYAKGLEDLVVTTLPDGRKVNLTDIGTVRDIWADTPNRSYINGKPAVRINVSNTIEEDLIGISSFVTNYIDEFNEKNDVVKASLIDDGAILLNQRIDLLANNGFIGFFLVILLLAMFLQVRLAFWVAIAIPVSLLGMFMVANFVGVSINVISLFGMILVIGILVDDGIVISENIYSHFEQGKSRFRAALDGTMEVIPAVFAAIATTMVAFGSFLFLDGITGDFFSEMSVVIILTLLFSLIEGAFILPGHVAHSLVREGGSHEHEPYAGNGEIGFNHDEKDIQTNGTLSANGTPKQPNRVQAFFLSIQDRLWGFMDWMKDRLYAPILRYLMDNVFLGLAIPVVLFMISLGLIQGGFVETTFFPVIEGDLITITLEMPAGTREFITEEKLDKIEAAVWKVNEQYKSERADGKDVILIVNKNLGPTTYQGNMLVKLLDSETRNIRTLELSERLRKEVGIIYGAETLTFGAANPFGKPVSIAMFGNNLNQLDDAVNELKGKMGEMPDLRDITDTNQEGLREVNLKLKEKAYLLGLTPQIIAFQVRQGFFGAEVQRLQRGEDEVKVWVRYDLTDRSSIDKLEDMRIRTANGQAYPLKEVAEYEVERGVIAINRLDGKREIRVEADVASGDVSTTEVITIVTDELLPPILAKYPSVSFSLEGQVRENAKTGASAGTVFPIALLLIVTIIILTFRSYSQTIAVLAIIPFGFIGVVLGHLVFDKQISILSGLGIFALIGIMVNDALVLVSAHNNLIQQGKKFREALYEASLSRFRPIFLTSITTIAGLGPLVFEKSFQAQFLIPMALSVAFGLAVATLIILITLPVILVITNQLKVMSVALYEGKRPDPTSVEPALEGRKGYSFLYVGVILAFVALIVLIMSFFS